MSDYFIILGAGHDQIPAYKAARDLGIKTIAVDYNPESPGFELADISVVASVKNKEETIGALQELNLSYKGVITLGVEIAPIVSAIAEKFGLIAVSMETAHLTTNKCARNVRLKKCGIPIPEFQIVDSFEAIKMPLPLVIKPSDNSASRGVRRMDWDKHLFDAFKIAHEFSTDGNVLIEELLEGPQISIEGFMLDGKMFNTGFADRNYDKNKDYYPFFMEDGSVSPSDLPIETQREGKCVFEKAALSLGIRDGPSKGDLIVTEDGVKVIEITSRLSGGGLCSRIVPLQTGVDIVSATVRWACGMYVSPEEFVPRWNKTVCHRFFFHEPGLIRKIRGLDKIEDMPGVNEFVIQHPFRVGDILKPVTYANRLFYVITVADDRETAIRYAEDAINSVEIVVE